MRLRAQGGATERVQLMGERFEQKNARLCGRSKSREYWGSIQDSGRNFAAS